MKIQMLNNKIGVEKLKKVSKKQSGIILPEVTDSLGIIRYTGHLKGHVSVGDKVYYGTQRTQIRMAGADIEIMDEDNIFAIVRDDEIETKTSQA